MNADCHRPTLFTIFNIWRQRKMIAPNLVESNQSTQQLALLIRCYIIRWTETKLEILFKFNWSILRKHLNWNKKHFNWREKEKETERNKSSTISNIYYCKAHMNIDSKAKQRIQQKHRQKLARIITDLIWILSKWLNTPIEWQIPTVECLCWTNVNQPAINSIATH